MRILTKLMMAILAAGLFSSIAAAPLPKIGHVFVIVLENEDYDTTFGANSAAPYLARELPAKGALLTQYYGIGHYSLDNYLAMISGQAPNPVTQSDCEDFTEFRLTGMAADGQAIGQGCVYPASIKTLANQMADAQLRWRGYMEDMGNDPTREAKSCAHPAIGKPDGTQIATATDQYATRHNPFVYFHAIIDRPDCGDHVVPLTALDADLADVKQTPNLVFITPNLCNDGHDSSCASGEAGGLAGINRALLTLVPKILAAPAFQQDGLLIVTFDEADSSEASACCDEQPGPNLSAPRAIYGKKDRGPGIGGPGGGRIGAVLISPFITPGTVSNQAYNHYAMLRSIEDIFALPHLGYAGQAGLRPFGTDIFTAASQP